MERLTRKEFEGTECEPYVYGGIEYYGDSYGGEVINKLAAYEDAEEQGLLLKLPCRVGDTVYEISLVEPYRNPAIREMGVTDILLRDDDIYLTLQDLHDEDYDNSILSTEIGKTVFLTEKEAEQALKEQVKIKVGDVVKAYGERKYVVIATSEEMPNNQPLLRNLHDNSVCFGTNENLIKTGKHIDIQSVLK